VVSPRQRSRGFVEWSLAGFLRAFEHAFNAGELARAKGLLQRLDPRMKVLGILTLVLAVAVAHRLRVVAGLFIVATVLAMLSRVPLRMLAKRVWIAVLFFTGVIALPALFVTPGRAVARLPLAGWPVTAPGLTAAAFLVLRVEAATTLTVLLVLSTPWNHVLKALRTLRFPAAVVVILGMTCRYIFLLLETAHAMFESRRSRMVGRMEARDRRQVLSACAGVLMSKSFQMSLEVYQAMQARGFRGDVMLLEDFESRPWDWLVLAALLLTAIAAFWLGR
jgi:cobalt/nickel transport system permease protein